jgi:DNA-directed RNA polymerase specialized sigma24 family protein
MIDASLTLQRLLAFLPDRRRQAIELRYWGHLSYAEIADALSTTPANAERLVARLVARGLIQLQELSAKLS